MPSSTSPPLPSRLHTYTYCYCIQTGDYTGSAFIRHVFYAVAAPYTDFLGVTPTTDNGLYRARAPKFYQFLRDIEPYLYSATASPAPYVPTT